MLVDGVEKCLDVHLALRTIRIRINLNESARKLLTIKRFRMKFGAVVEVKLARDGLDVRVQKHILTVQNYDWVNDVFQIAHLVCGDDDRAVLGGVFHQRTPELGLGRDVQTVRRLVEIQVSASECQCE